MTRQLLRATLKTKLFLICVLLIIAQRTAQLVMFFQAPPMFQETIAFQNFNSLSYATFILIPLYLGLSSKSISPFINPHIMRRFQTIRTLTFQLIFLNAATACIFTLLNNISGYMAYCIAAGTIMAIDIVPLSFTLVSQIVCLLLVSMLFCVGFTISKHPIVSAVLSIMYGACDYLMSYIPAISSSHFYIGWQVSLLAYELSEFSVLTLIIRQLAILLAVCFVLNLTLNIKGVEQLSLQRKQND